MLSAIRDTRPPLPRYSLIIYLLDRVFLRPYNFRGSKEAPSASALASYPTAHLLALMQILTGSSSFFENLSLSLCLYLRSKSQQSSNHATLIHFRFDLSPQFRREVSILTPFLHVAYFSTVNNAGYEIPAVDKRLVNRGFDSSLVCFYCFAVDFDFRDPRPPHPSPLHRLKSFIYPPGTEPPSYRFQGTLRIPLLVSFPPPFLGR